MMNRLNLNAEVVGILRQRKVLLPAAAVLVVALIWVVAVFNPQGHKLASVNANVQSAQNEQYALQARLDRLKIYSKESAKFEALAARLSTAVPPSTDVYPYITALSNAAAGAGLKIESIGPGPAAADGDVAAIPIVVAATGTYSQTLAFIGALYALPRLTVIEQVSITGGGNGTNRGTVLTDQFNLDIFATSSVVANQSSG
jgi:Tfp pilus assembly protein PilO